jgi:hypothetical protein
MKTLVIHPDDRSTDFLKEIYKDKDWTVINDYDICKSIKQITELIKNHDRIVMMGHGHPGGLFMSCINSDLVYLLREKECVCIWCNADKFVERYGLKGFYTGMFISEVGEAWYYNIEIDQASVDYSNNLFVTNFGKVIDSPTALNEIKSLYVGDNPVIKFNNDRLYYYDGNYDGDELTEPEFDLKGEVKDTDFDDYEFLII